MMACRDVRFLDVHVVDVEVDLDVRRADAPAHLDALRGRVEHVGLVAVHDFEPERDVALGRRLGHALQHSHGRLTPSAVVGTAYFWNAESRMPQTWVAPMSRAMAIGLFEARLAAPSFSRIVARDVGRGVEAERRGGADAGLLERTAGEGRLDGARVEGWDLDQVVADLGRLADGACGFVVAPAVLPDERVHAELVHGIAPSICRPLDQDERWNSGFRAW